MVYMGNEQVWCLFSFTCRSVQYALCCWIDVFRCVRWMQCICNLVVPASHVWYVRYTCDIYHDAMLVISLYRRVFDFTVSNVSSVSNLYFSGAERRHVCRHVNVSGVRNRCMYTLWWMMCEIGIWVKWTWDMFVSVTCLTTCGFASWFDLVGDMHRGLRSISSCVLKDVIDIHLGSICECVSYMCALNRESCIRHLDECRQCFRSMIAFWIVACSIITKLCGMAVKSSSLTDGIPVVNCVRHAVRTPVRRIWIFVHGHVRIVIPITIGISTPRWISSLPGGQ